MKDEYKVIRDNSFWLLGDGSNINFWNDRWCGEPLSDQLNIPDHLKQHLISTVKDYIHDGHWCIPLSLSQVYPNLYSLISHVVIPLQHSPDQLLWKHTDNGDLSLKEAYSFKTVQYQETLWV
jgi:hypothetical protein